jgi:hypothetical protein
VPPAPFEHLFVAKLLAAVSSLDAGAWDTRLMSGDVRDLAARLGDRGSLTQLSLCGSRLLCSLDALSACRRLWSLDLHNCGLATIEPLRILGSLGTLDVSNNRLSLDAALTARHLVLGCLNLTDNLMRAQLEPIFGRGVSGDNQLRCILVDALPRTLCLDGSFISNDERQQCHAFAAASDVWTTLTELQIAGPLAPLGVAERPRSPQARAPPSHTPPHLPRAPRHPPTPSCRSTCLTDSPPLVRAAPRQAEALSRVFAEGGAADRPDHGRIADGARLWWLARDFDAERDAGPASRMAHQQPTLSLCGLASSPWLNGSRRLSLMVLLAYSLVLPVEASAAPAALARILRPEAERCVPTLLGLPPYLRAALLHLLVQRGHDGTSSPDLWHFLSQGVGTAADVLSSRGGDKCVARARALLAGDDSAAGTRTSLPSVRSIDAPLAALDSTGFEAGGSQPRGSIRPAASRGSEAAPPGLLDSPVHGSAYLQVVRSRAVLKPVARGDDPDSAPATAAATHPCSTSHSYGQSSPTRPQPAQLYSDNISWEPQFVLSSSVAIRSPAKRAGGGGSAEAVLGWSSLQAPAYLVRKPDDSFLHVQHSEPADTSAPSPSHSVGSPTRLIIPAIPMSAHERRALYEPARAWFAVKARAALVLPDNPTLEAASAGLAKGKLYAAVQLHRQSREKCGRSVRKQARIGERRLREVRSPHAAKSVRPASPPLAHMHHRVNARHPSTAPLQARVGASPAPATPFKATSSLAVLSGEASLDNGFPHRCGGGQNPVKWVPGTRPAWLRLEIGAPATPDEDVRLTAGPSTPKSGFASHPAGAVTAADYSGCMHGDCNWTYR